MGEGRDERVRVIGPRADRTSSPTTRLVSRVAATVAAVGAAIVFASLGSAPHAVPDLPTEAPIALVSGRVEHNPDPAVIGPLSPDHPVVVDDRYRPRPNR